MREKLFTEELLQLVLEFHPKCGTVKMKRDFYKAYSIHTFVLFLKFMQILWEVSINVVKEKEVNFHIAYLKKI